MVDIDPRSVPSGHRPTFITERFPAKRKPSEGAVRAPQPHFTRLVGISVTECFAFFCQCRKVVRMKRGLPAPAIRLFTGETCKLAPSLINEVHGTVRTTGPRERRNSVD